MTEGFLQSFDSDLEIISAGTKPGPRVHPLAIEVMSEIGIDISRGMPKHVKRFLDQAFDHVLTVCGNAEEDCPVFTGTVGKRSHIAFDDPALAEGDEEAMLDAFRRVRDEIGVRMREFYESEVRKEP